MSKFLKITGAQDYKVKVDSGQTITLDTGTGTVRVNGDFIVSGTSTSVETVNLEIEDNVIVLNKGESGAEITEGFAGIQIDRGSATTGDVEFVYVEDAGNWYESRLGSNNSDGVWMARYQQDPTRLIALRTYDIDSNGDDLNLVGGGNGRVTVKGTLDYETGVFAYTAGVIDSTLGAQTVIQTTPSVVYENTDDTLVNAKALVDYVEDYVRLSSSNKIQQGNTSITITDPGANPFGIGEISILTDGLKTMTIDVNQVDIQGLTLSGTIIEVNDTGEDLILRATGTNSVRVDDSLIISQSPYIGDGIDPNTPGEGEGTKLYSKPRGSGDTGVFFANTKDGTEKRDELVSKSKAILFGILF
jgi:hypothetical protein